MKKWLFIGLSLLLTHLAFAQNAPNKQAQTPKPANFHVLQEYTDEQGQNIKIIEYEKNGSWHKGKFISPKKIPPPAAAAFRPMPVNPDTLLKDSLAIVVHKAAMKLEVFYKHKLMRSYKAVFGPEPLKNKCMEGDRCTPEGAFTIKRKNPYSKYDKFLLLSYPNDSSYQRFHDLQQSGVIPKNAHIGNNVGIHGTWRGADDMIELGVGWTDGCIAIKNKDIEELFQWVNVGCPVLIMR